MHRMGWPITKSELCQVRKRSQLLSPGWLFPQARGPLSTVSQSQTHCQHGYTNTYVGKSLPVLVCKPEMLMQPLSQFCLLHFPFFLGPGNKNFFADSTHRAALMHYELRKCIHMQLKLHLICKGTEQLSYVKLIQTPPGLERKGQAGP